jgi:hypothetical protein
MELCGVAQAGLRPLLPGVGVRRCIERRYAAFAAGLGLIERQVALVQERVGADVPAAVIYGHADARPDR